jgi:hypothetical protein
MSFIYFLDILSNFHFFALIGPELIDHSENDGPADQEDYHERQRIPVSAVQKIADSE